MLFEVSKKPCPLFLKDNIKLDEIPSQIKLKIYDYFILLIKSYMIQLPVLLFLDVYTSRELHSPLSEKKIFDISFPILMDSPPAPLLIPHPVNSQNP